MAEPPASGESIRRSSPIPNRFALYLPSFYVVWTLYLVFVTSRYGGGVGFLTLENLVKIAIWTLPVLLLVRLDEREDVLDYLKLRRNWRRGAVAGIGLGVVLSAYLVAIHLRGFDFDPAFAWGQWLSGVILVALSARVQSSPRVEP